MRNGYLRVWWDDGGSREDVARSCMEVMMTMTAEFPLSTAELLSSVPAFPLLLFATAAFLLAKLAALLSLLLFELFPVSHHLFDLATKFSAAEWLVDAHGRRVVTRFTDLLLSLFEFLFRDHLVWTLEGGLEVLSGYGELGVFEVVVVGKRTDGGFRARGGRG